MRSLGNSANIRGLMRRHRVMHWHRACCCPAALRNALMLKKHIMQTARKEEFDGKGRLDQSARH